MDYSSISLKSIREAIGKMFHGRQRVKSRQLEALDYAELRSRILIGYAYKIESMGPGDPGERRVAIHTGQGGVLQYIDNMERNGWPAWLTADQIICFTDHGPCKVSYLKVVKRESARVKKSSESQ